VYTGVKNYLDKVPADKVGDFERGFVKHIRETQQALLAEIRNKQQMTKEIDEQLKTVCAEFVAKFLGGKAADATASASAGGEESKQDALKRIQAEVKAEDAKKEEKGQYDFPTSIGK